MVAAPGTLPEKPGGSTICVDTDVADMMPNHSAYRQMARVPAAGDNVATATRRLAAGTVVVDEGPSDVFEESS